MVVTASPITLDSEQNIFGEPILASTNDYLNLNDESSILNFNFNDPFKTDAAVSFETSSDPLNFGSKGFSWFSINEFLVQEDKVTESLYDHIVSPRDQSWMKEKAELARKAFCTRKSKNDQSDKIYHFAEKSEDEINISFAGNEETLLKDLQSADHMSQFPEENPISGARILQKFRDEYKNWHSENLADINSIIEQAKKDSNLVTFVGFGIGGVYAELAALDYAQNNLPNIPKPLVFTFGQPRIGNEKFAEGADDRLEHWRSTFGHDKIPQLPTGEYIHDGTEIWNNGVDRESFYCNSDTSLESQMCVNSSGQQGDNDHFGPYYEVTMTSNWMENE
ncbi:hypothetical protein G9A89_005511 [Geosiphon pyriformis]|nr:hypothetical protein G9A89_005511 [Geosiphon pyriformis]